MVGVDVNTIIGLLPQDNSAAMFILLIMFEIKSLTMVFPLSWLFFASGILFSPVKAICVSLSGQLIALTIPYIIGRKCGSERMERYRKKYPKLNRLMEYQEQNTVFLCFIMRIIALIPGDVLSLYFGSCMVPYYIYAPLSLAGCIPIAVCYTLLGDEVSNPKSAAFIGLIACRLILCVISICISIFMEKKQKSEKSN